MSFIWKGDGGGGSGGSCSASGHFTIPPEQDVTINDCQDLTNMFFPEGLPVTHISVNPTCSLREKNEVVSNPVITGSVSRGANDSDDLDKIEWYRDGNLINTQQPAVYDTQYDYQDTIDISDNTVYTVKGIDVAGDNSTASCQYTFTYPYYGTSSDINTLTKQNLVPLTAQYFQISMVAETDTEKQKADFHSSITITGVQFYNTVSGQWEWLGGSKSASLNYWDTTNVTEQSGGVNENYVRYTHNDIKTGSRQLRFWRV